MTSRLKTKCTRSFTLLAFITALLLTSSSLQSETVNRVRYTLNDQNWKFIREDVKNAQKSSFKDDEWLDITLPHDFNGGSDGVHNDVFQGRFDFRNDQDKRLMYKGPTWYRTKLTVDEKYDGKRIFIEFEGVTLEAQVFVNGKKVGTHRGGYTAFSYDITKFLKLGKENTLAVRVDNSNNPQIAPWMANEKGSFPFSFDYAVYGGIYRNVWLSITDPVKIERVLNTPVVGGQAPTVINVETRIKNYSKSSVKASLQTTILDPSNKEISTQKVSRDIASGEEMSVTQSESNLGNVMLWSPNKPSLYTVKSTLSYDGKVVDEYTSNFGVRYFTLTDGEAFSINGKKMLLKGVNRHQDMEGLGYALPDQQHVDDVLLLKDAGFNFIRHAHYPSAPAFAAACQEQGVMLWLEIPLTGSVSDDPQFLENCKQQLTEMIEQNYNNPAVVVWGIGNESDRSGGNEKVSNHVFSELVKLAKELDPSRPTTGCNWQYKSNQDIVDIYSPQDWSGWYGNRMPMEYNPTSIIGEYGADMDVPNHTEESFHVDSAYVMGNNLNEWSQEFGCFLHEYKVSKGFEHQDNFPGHCVWVGFDFASPRIGRDQNPIPNMNQKGLVMHDHKTKKDAFYFYQSMYRSAKDRPMVYIASHTWTDRWVQPEKKDVWVYSNCDSVQLYNAYEELPLGMRTKNAGPNGDTRFQWDDADIKYNILYAEGWYNNEIVARDTIILENLPVPELNE